MFHRQLHWLELSEGSLEFLFLDDSSLDSLVLEQSDGWSVTSTDYHHVCDSGGESRVLAVDHVDDRERGVVLLDSGDSSDSALVWSGHHDGYVALLELVVVSDLVGLEAQLHGIVGLDVWVWESQGSAVVGDNVWDLVLADCFVDDLAELEGRFFSVDFVWLESALDVNQYSEELSGLLNAQDVHHAEWELRVSSCFIVNLDDALLVLDEFLNFDSVETIL